MNITTVDSGFLRIENMNIAAGPGNTSGTGIYFKIAPLVVGAKPIAYDVRISDLMVRDFGGWGIIMDGGIVSSIEKCLIVGNGNGVFINGDPLGTDSPWPSTSTSVRDCYFNRNDGIGLKFKNVDYSGIYSCAADHNNIHYQIVKCKSVSFYSCGAEYADVDDPEDGIGYDIQGCVGTTFYNCFMYNSKVTTVKVSSYTSAPGVVQNCFQVSFIGFNDVLPLGNSIVLDENNNLSIDNCAFPGAKISNGTLLRPSSVKVDDSGLVTTQGDVIPDSNRLYSLGSGSMEWDGVRAGQIRLTYTDAIYLANSSNVIIGTGAGTKIGTAPDQKIGLWGKDPVAQPLLATGVEHTVDDVITALQNIGIFRQS